MDNFLRSRLCRGSARGGFSHAFRAITHNAKTKTNAKKSYFVISYAPFQGLSIDSCVCKALSDKSLRASVRLPIDGKHLFVAYYIIVVWDMQS